MLIQKNEEYLTYLVDGSKRTIARRFINAAKRKTNRLLWDQPKKMQSLFWKTGIRHYFDAIVDGNDVSNAKDPEVFLIAAKLLDVNPENAIVLKIL
jgi:beta-phosphoglucomutase